MEHQFVLILDFGGQYNQLIARRVRECGVYCEVRRHDMPLDEMRALSPVGIIFTGGPNSVYGENAPQCDAGVFSLGVPILGICYGNQLLAQAMGGHVAAANGREYGRTATEVDGSSLLFQGLPAAVTTWMSHGDYVDRLPDGFRVIAKSANCPVGGIESAAHRFYGVQFHPEVLHTEHGQDMLRNFLFRVCGCTGDWSMGNYAQASIARLKEQIGGGRVLLALSGGVDSAVAAALLSRAVGKNLTCIFVDHGLMRKDEGDEVQAAFRDSELQFVRVDAEARFLARLAGVTDPERKRKIIGEEFIRVFEEEARKIGTVDFLAQGTIYPDVIESGLGDAAVIKSHHNVGGLPEHVQFKQIVEPLRMLFKDEVRALGRELGLPDYLVWRQPFPGPGLAIRIIGEITKEKLEILRDADAVFREEIANAGLARDINQYFAVLTDMRSVGVMGDGRTYDYTLALRGVTTSDFMTADWAHIPYDVLSKISDRVINEVHGINRVVYDVTSKPPATIEWE